VRHSVLSLIRHHFDYSTGVRSCQVYLSHYGDAESTIGFYAVTEEWGSLRHGTLSARKVGLSRSTVIVAAQFVCNISIDSGEAIHALRRGQGRT